MPKYILYFFLFTLSSLTNPKDISKNDISSYQPSITNKELLSKYNPSKSIDPQITSSDKLPPNQLLENISIKKIEKICPVCLQPAAAQTVIYPNQTTTVSNQKRDAEDIIYINLDLLHQSIDNLEKKIELLEEKIKMQRN